MDLKRIAHLMQVAEHGSFSKAASVIGIAQPALGRQVKKLEEECGTALLYRHGRGVSLTPDGERLLARLQPLLRQMEAAIAELHDEHGNPSGHVTLGLTPTVCGMLGVRLAQALRQNHPRIRLNVITGYSGYIHEWLTDARVDLAVLHDARRSPQLVVNPLAELDLCLVSSPRTLSPVAAQQAHVPVRQLGEFSMVLPTRNHGLRRTVERAASDADVVLDVAYEVDALDLMKGMVEAGLAHTILARPAVQHEVAAGTLLARTLTEPRLSTRLLSAFSANRPLTRAVRLVEQTLRQILAEMAGEEETMGAVYVLTDDAGSAP